MKLNLKTRKSFFQNFPWAVIFISVGGGLMALYFINLPCKFPAIKEKCTNVLHAKAPNRTIPVNITVAHAGVKSEGMGYLCYSGYIIDPKKPARICAVSDDIRALFPFFSHINIRSAKCPLINGKWLVVDRSTMSKCGIEIYIPNSNEVTFGGSWKGELILN